MCMATNFLMEMVEVVRVNELDRFACVEKALL